MREALQPGLTSLPLTPHRAACSRPPEGPVTAPPRTSTGRFRERVREGENPGPEAFYLESGRNRQPETAKNPCPHQPASTLFLSHKSRAADPRERFRHMNPDDVTK